jgi:hypothetical protein
VESGDALDIGWLNSGSELDFARSTNQGNTFATAIVASNLIELNSLNFATGTQGEIDLVYDAAAVGDNFDVFFTKSVDHGQTYSTPMKLNLPTVQNFTGGGDPSIGVDSSDKITVAWEDDSKGTFSGDFDIYTRTSSDGITFNAAVNVSNTTDQQEVFPMVIEGTNGLFLTWSDTSNPQNSNTSLSVFFDAIQ